MLPLQSVITHFNSRQNRDNLSKEKGIPGSLFKHNVLLSVAALSPLERFHFSFFFFKKLTRARVRCARKTKYLTPVVILARALDSLYSELK